MDMFRGRCGESAQASTSAELGFMPEAWYRGKTRGRFEGWGQGGLQSEWSRVGDGVEALGRGRGRAGGVARVEATGRGRGRVGAEAALEVWRTTEAGLRITAEGPTCGCRKDWDGTQA